MTRVPHDVPDPGEPMDAAGSPADAPGGQPSLLIEPRTDKDKETEERAGVSPAGLSVSLTKTVLRPADLLSLKFDFVNLQRSGNSLVRISPGAATY